MKNTNFVKKNKNTNFKKNSIQKKQVKKTIAKTKLNEDVENNIKLLEKYINNKLNKDITEINTNSLLHYITTAKKENNEKYSDAWKKKMIFSLKAYYKELKKPIKLIDKTADKYFKQLVNDELQQKQTQKELDNYLTYDELNILLNENKEYKTKRHMNQYLLISSLATDQPPLRPQLYSNFYIITNKKDIKDDDKNYMHINKQQKKGYLYINDDKVCKFNTKNKIIELQPRFLNIILESLKKYPRKKFIEYDNVKNVEKKLLDELRLITHNKLTFHMARSSFINNWLKQNPQATDAQKIKLAQEMRHTLQSQIIYYKKQEPVNGNLQKIKDKEEQKPQKKQNEDKEPKKYDKYKEVNKIRALIAKANRLKQNIKDETMLKYGILKDKDGKYYYPKQEKEKKIKKVNKKVILSKQI